ncbi:unnamed protein product, partial [Mesorhabditis belari]|uniref:ATP synthase-coupling factor 6, mitochondrial n=1 Tax=Mesorhabditis belari TaxID=2138241 RepID=A0AAF3EV46_9BILA
MYRAVRTFSTTPICRKPDLVQQAFVNKIKEFGQKGGDLANSDPAVKKALQQELDRVATKYQFGNTADVGKLDVKLASAKVESSVKAELEGKTVQDLIAQVKAEEKRFIEQQASRRADEARKAAAAQGK